MCGILCYSGPNAKMRVRNDIAKIKHRGPDDTSFFDNENISIGFNRLAINDLSEAGRQPYSYKNYVAAINGEVYNYTELQRKYKIHTNSQCDTHVILPIFDISKSQTLAELDGFYSGVIFDKQSQKLYCIRDHIGKKPLFWGKSGSEIFITSELKAVSGINYFEMLPKGLSSVDFQRKEVMVLEEHKLVTLPQKAGLKKLVENAVLKRLPSSKFGIFLSGGLDSSIIASIVAKYRKDVIYYSLANKNSIDYSFIKQLGKYLAIKIKSIEIPQHLEKIISQVVYTTESYNPSIISNGICTYILAEAAHKDGLKVILCGEGADELFCGYHMFEKKNPWQKVRQNLIDDMCFTELRRVDQSCMANSIENRCPFLDREIYSFASTLTYDDFYGKYNGVVANKYALRKAFEEDRPQSIVHRKKVSFDVGSGVRALTVDSLTQENLSEKQQLKKIWLSYFQMNPETVYCHSYPVFDEAIAKRGAVHK